MIEVGRPGGAREIEVPTQRGLPATLPVLPLRDTVTFPETLVPLAVGQERSMALINDALGGDRMIAMVASRDPELEAPGPEALYDVGVAGVVARMLKVPDGTLRILVQATQRIRVTGYARVEPYLVAQVEELPDISTTETPELLALVRNVQATFTNIVEQVPYLPEELHVAVANLDDPGALSHLIAGALRLRAEEKQALLQERDVARRLRRLSELLASELEVVALGSKIQSSRQDQPPAGIPRAWRSVGTAGTLASSNATSSATYCLLPVPASLALLCKAALLTNTIWQFSRSSLATGRHSSQGLLRLRAYGFAMQTG